MKTVCITGGATGIGKACAELFAKNNFNIVVNYYHSENDAINLQKQLSNITHIEIFKADISKFSECQNLIDFVCSKFNKIDILINNAGIDTQKLLIDCTEKDIINCINTNLSSMIFCSKFACENMIKHSCGNIINISSIYAYTGSATETIYSATKSAMLGFTKALAREMGSANIRVNAIAPGAINTRMNNNFTIKEQSNFFENAGIKRMGTPEEIAHTVLFLTSDEASYINGQTITVDGCLI